MCKHKNKKYRVTSHGNFQVSCKRCDTTITYKKERVKRVRNDEPLDNDNDTRALLQQYPRTL